MRGSYRSRGTKVEAPSTWLSYLFKEASRRLLLRSRYTAEAPDLCRVDGVGAGVELRKLCNFQEFKSQALHHYTILLRSFLAPDWGFGEGHCAGCLIRTRLRLLWWCRGQVAGWWGQRDAWRVWWATWLAIVGNMMVIAMHDPAARLLSRKSACVERSMEPTRLTARRPSLMMAASRDAPPATPTSVLEEDRFEKGRRSPILRRFASSY